MKKLMTAWILLLGLGLFGFEPADVVYDDCKALQEARCDQYRAEGAGQAKNVILMIGDGMGLNQIYAARVKANGPKEPLALESLPHRGLATTCSLSGTTDSAAAGTALATGHKAVNKDISLSPQGEKWETVLELAEKLGKRTGLVTTAPITDATPAVFGAHVPARAEQPEVAQNYLTETKPNLLLGGGRHYFSGVQMKMALADGYAIVDDLPGLEKLDPAKVSRVLGLFAVSNMTYETDFKPGSTEPHLHEMAAFALKELEQDPKGFFMMIEGGQIDHACHAGDLDKAIAETLEFNRTVQLVLDWIGSRTDTLLIITADHETGGIAITPKDYQKGDTVEARFTTKFPFFPATHSKQEVEVFAEGPNAAAIKAHQDNTAISCIMREAMTTKR
jgi:alkaline phosphatase